MLVSVTMTASTTAILLAVLAAAVSITSAVGTEIMRKRSGQQLARLQAESDRRSDKFRDDLARNREEDNKQAEARQLVGRYRDPLLLSAFDLQSRIYNVLRPGGFRGTRHPDYFRLSTLFVIADFFGWLEIVRREMQFLDLGAADDTKQLADKLGRVKEVFASTSLWRDDYYIYRAEQRAIGELMISRLESADRTGPRHECLGYASFVAKQDEPSFAQWFERLGTALQELPGRNSERLTEVQSSLIDVIDFLDPKCDRLTGHRERLTSSRPH
jgi:hypothetical protein